MKGLHCFCFFVFGGFEKLQNVLHLSSEVCIESEALYC